ncbi:SIR2 family NAD-dependent protein deacylase [Clostridium chrysemydis]|uniref:SIR2 family NAD-dependent protein deacylase n=1 Tax=Clostridium chrysemydis TaxID=2665504 RepID=UPI003F31C4B9
MKDLAQNIKNGKVILFVGAGVSASLSLPTWNQLMDHLSKELDIEPEIFKLYGDNLSLAEYYCLEKGTIGPLRSWMDREWHVDDCVLRESRIHELICKLNFPIIYTTNYDRSLESSFRVFGCPFEKIIGVEDLYNISNEKAQIIKLHGDFDSDESIVLTESSYFERMNFESPLDLKLRSDILGKSILFIGYSLSDINIKYLIFKLNKLWAGSNNKSKRPKSFIFLTSPNPIQERIMEERGIYPIIGKETNPSKSLETFLEMLYSSTEN